VSLWTLKKAVDKRRIQGFQMTAYAHRQLLVATGEFYNASDQCISATRSTTTGTSALCWQLYRGASSSISIRARKLCIEMLEGRVNGRRKRDKLRRTWTARDLAKKNSCGMLTVNMSAGAWNGLSNEDEDIKEAAVSLWACSLCWQRPICSMHTGVHNISFLFAHGLCSSHSHSHTGLYLAQFAAIKIILLHCSV